MAKHRDGQWGTWPKGSIARALVDLAARYRCTVAPLVPTEGDLRQAAHICSVLYDEVRPGIVAEGIERYIIETMEG